MLIGISERVGLTFTGDSSHSMTKLIKQILQILRVYLYVHIF